MIKKKFIICWLVIPLFLYSCSGGYSFTGADISADIKTFSVSNFENRAPLVQPTLSNVLTEAIIDRFLAQTNLELVKNNADLSFNGEITGYNISPQAFTGGETAALNRLTITVKVRFENIDQTNLAIYEVEMKDNGKPVFVITVSDQQFRKAIEKYTNKMLLTFGKKSLNESTFMETATGIISSEEKGYVMMRDGSVTGVSTSIEIIEGEGEIEIVLYKNGKETGFKNQFNEKGIQSDYDIQSEGVVEFQKGDIISLKVINEDFINIKDINTLLEVMTE